MVLSPMRSTIHLIIKAMEELEYWKKRCELSEAYISESPCDPDITSSQLVAYLEWNLFKKSITILKEKQ